MKENKKAIVLFRNISGKSKSPEMDSCIKNFKTYKNRVLCSNSLVIGRYSTLPNYKELEEDLLIIGSRLINTYEQHKYISSFEYYTDIEKYTPKTWFSLQQIPDNKKLFIKGKTNSKKFDFPKSCIASNRKEASDVFFNLMSDSMIGDQGVVFREFVELDKIEDSVNGLPISNEWRVFFIKDTVVDFGYYWSYIDDLEKVSKIKPDFISNGLPFAKKVAKIISKKTNFFVIDVAKTSSGEWIVVEVNDGQQSGLSLIDESLFYSRLSDSINKIY